ncbi:membrane-associated zinc metalloprotease [Gracilibacillus boraciitolerans JCM 21714]|uniref:Zinc metalloprotease n=1 Tax=Gracilibacillus boraciitolerans JCM 21714 TaxID=1298598 RepID=W4VFI7_9BACI|nr:RIP metalloprotease RseP [Gracilibacillus boraciitolerans]GAE91588.1 membrane-associated zinc metalloprotease [Gracilibacillus boraciitolerans JCM 21714]
MNTVIAFILMFGVLVFVHEFGHYYVAKRTGMLVREFAIGFGPKVFSTVKNETLYTIRLLPMGGYVRVAGEDPEIVDIKPGQHIGLTFNDAGGEVNQIIVNNKAKHPDALVIEVEHIDLDHALIIEGYEIDADSKYSFHVNPKADFIMDEKSTQIAPYNRQFASKTVGQRGLQLFAGPLMNFVLTIVIFIVLANIQGVPVEDVRIGSVVDNSPASEAGFQANDTVLKIEDQAISEWEEFQEIVQASPEESLEMTVLRGDKQISLEVTPALIETPEQEIGQVGVTLALEKSFLRSIPYSFEETYRWSTLILTNLGKLVTGQFSIDMLSGPVGIYDATDQVVKTGFLNFLTWTAVLSVNLGIINLVPLPALDGGRLIFVGIEAVRGKPIDPQKEGVVHFIGFALLMLLMIVVTWNDIQRLFL